MKINKNSSSILLQRNKALATIFLILVLTIPALMISLPAVNAAVVMRPVYVYNSAAPNPIGVGQTTLIVMWTDIE